MLPAPKLPIVWIYLLLFCKSITWFEITLVFCCPCTRLFYLEYNLNWLKLHTEKKCVPKTMVFLWFCCFVFSMFWSLGTIRINRNQIWIILPLGHHVFIKCTLYKSLLKKNKHVQYSLEMCDFPFNGWSLWGCVIVFFCWVKHVL